MYKYYFINKSIIVHIKVLVKPFSERRGEKMPKNRYTEFGILVQIGLLKSGHSQKWLIQRCREQTGMYIDSGYLNRLLTGQRNSPKLEAAIKEILHLKEERKKV